MLPQAHRLRRSAEFAHVVRRGSRCAAASLVLHTVVRVDAEPIRVGFVVGRTVGNAVRRNAVKRRLRHLVADRLPLLPAHSSVVVRANPAATDADFARLGADLDRCLRTLSRRSAPS